MVDTGGSSWHSTNRGVSVYIGIYLALFVLVLILSKFLHDKPRIGSLVPEAAMIIMVGMMAGYLLHFVVYDTNDASTAAGAVYYAADGEDAAEEDADSSGNSGYEDVAASIFSFSPTIFFIILLPPIIFNSGYHLQRDLFFRYISPICLYACVGTAVCTLVMACLLHALSSAYFVGYDAAAFAPTFLELLTFSSLLSATDPVSTLAVFSTKKVDPHLFYLVFGESVINDAVGLVLFNALAHLVESHQLNAAVEGQELNVTQEVLQFIFDFVVSFLGSLVLGTVFALCYGLLFKHVDMRHTKLLELCVYSTMVYSPFVVAEVLHLSGIVTVLMTGVAARRYAEPNLSRSTSNHADCLFRMVAHSTETIIFLELGLSVVELLRFGGQQQSTATPALNYMFLLCALLACLVGRAANIYPITLLHNIFLVKGGCSFSCCSWPRRGKSKMDGVFKKPLVKTKTKKQATITTLNDEDYYKQTDKDGNIIRTEEATTTTTITVPSSPASVSGSSSTNDDETAKLTMMDDARIPWKTANMLWFSGLRGAVSYALVKTFPQTGNEHCFVVTTMLTVLVTTFVFGGGTETALNALHIEMNVDEQEYLKTVERKKLLGNGWLGRFEAYQVRAWVLRDFEKVQKQEEQPLSANGSGSGASSRSADDDDSETGAAAAAAVEKRQDSHDDSMLYHEPVEMTEHDHMSVAAAAANTSSKMKKRRTTSKTQLYDFGQ